MNKSNENAIKTGMYASASLLSWEPVAEFEAFRAGIFDEYRPKGPIEESIVVSIVDNRWLRKRLRWTTAIASHRHVFGLALEKSGSKSWSDALSFVREHKLENREALRVLGASTDELAKTAASFLKEETDELEERMQEVAAKCSKICKAVEGIETELDMEREFFLEYLPAHFEQRIRVEKSLDAQFDKLCAQLVIAQEARIRREKLQQATGNSLTVESHDDAKKAVKEPQTEVEAVDPAELDRNDNDDDDEWDP